MFGSDKQFMDIEYSALLGDLDGAEALLQDVAGYNELGAIGYEKA